MSRVTRSGWRCVFRQPVGTANSTFVPWQPGRTAGASRSGMQASDEQYEIVLALNPTRHGLGVAIFEGPNSLIEWGVREVGTDVAVTLRVVGGFLTFYEPRHVVLEETDDPSSRRRSPFVELIARIRWTVLEAGVEVHSYPRGQIRDVFKFFNAQTKYEIAKKIGEWLPQFEESLPRYRKPWMNEDHRMPMYDALSLAFTYYYVEGLCDGR